MAFKPENLHVLTYAGEFTLWHYNTEDHSVLSEGYFDPAEHYLRTYDVIMCTVRHGSPDARFQRIWLRSVDRSTGTVIADPT